MSVTCNGPTLVPAVQVGGAAAGRSKEQCQGPGDRPGCVVSYLPFLKVSQ